MDKQNGFLVISLDFELHWGARDKNTLTDDLYRERMLGVRAAIPAILKLFAEYNIHATWATVGFLFFQTRSQLIRGCPGKKPKYLCRALNPYPHIQSIGENAKTDLFHFAPSLIKLILSYPNQEIGTHTFSHYYCMENGQDRRSFESDLAAAKRAAQDFGINLKSLVFPRNQFNREYLPACAGLGINVVRGNPFSWIYQAGKTDDNLFFRRAAKLIDTYLNIDGYHCHSLDKIASSFPFNIPASRFLRSYSRSRRFFEFLRLRRILHEMTYAAQKKLVYHLWWHPESFGLNLQQNIIFLHNILRHYKYLHEKDGMTSLNMGEISDLLMEQAAKRPEYKEGYGL